MVYAQLAFFPGAVVMACWLRMRAVRFPRLWWLAIAGPFGVIALVIVGHRLADGVCAAGVVGGGC